MKSKGFLIPALLLLLMMACHTDTGVDNTDEDVEKTTIHDDPSDYVWDNSQVTEIVMKGASVTVTGTGASVAGSVVTISSAGNYRISGSLSNGQVIVNSTGTGVVRLLLNGVSMVCSNNAPVYVIAADKVMINLAANSVNSFTDGSSYSVSDEPNAAIYSKTDLTIFGEGSLTVNGNYNDGITSKDGLIIDSGNITVNALDDGIRGKDYLLIKNGNINVKTGGDGLKSDNETNTGCGYISILTGVFNINSKGDAISAQTSVNITDGKFDIVTGGGSSTVSATSAKGIKGITKLMIETGTFTINAADDALHTNKNMIVNSGTFSISSADDGLHADSTLVINGGDINITKSYEGIESAIVTINAGNIHVISSDDGINGAGGGGGTVTPGGGFPGQQQGTGTGKYFFYLNGGYVYVDAMGDGVDINGSIVMTNGNLIVNGPTANDNGALDYDGTCQVTGGTIIAVGSSGMAQAPGTTSTVNSILLTFRSTQAAGTLVNFQTAEGKELITFAPSKKFQTVVFTSPELQKGSAYKVYYGGSSSGTSTDGIYKNGSYISGTQYASFTISSVVTKVN